MSDDWNLHDAVEDGIRDNAGHLALAGALFAHSQRKQQLQSLEASRQHQAQIAKTEAERLQIEKQRLELEKLKQQAEKEEKEAVRLLRVMMAEVGLALDSFMSRGELKGSPQGARRDYVMAVLQSKLALVRSRSSSLSDLSDLKELARLEELSEDLVAKHFPGGDPLQLTRAKWRELQAWMQGVEAFEKQVKQACAVVPEPKALQLPSPTDLAAMQAKLQAFSAQLASDLSEHVSRLPAEAASGGLLMAELAEQAQLEDLAAGKQASRAKAFANRWLQVAVTRAVKEPGMLTSPEVPAGMVQDVKSALAKLQQWQDKAVDHEKTLQDLRLQLEEGQLKAAEASVKKLGAVRFAGLDYQAVSECETVCQLRETLVVSKRGAAMHLVADLRKRYPKAATQSELGRLLEKEAKRVSGEKRRAMAGLILMICLAAGIAKVGYDNHLEKRRFAAEAKAKAEAERRELPQKLQSTKEGSQVNLLLTDAVAQVFALAPAGSFTMGSPASEDGRSSDENQVEVTLSQPFWLAKTEVTQAQWEAVMGSNPSSFKGPNLPVETVSWEDAQAFIAKLNEKQILPPGWKFALPTEAQWEYACRAGEKGPYSGGTLDEVGWYEGNSESRTHEVGQKKPNSWGLHDMHGNVYEWCADWYENALKRGTDLAGPSSGDYRVDRGGSWNFAASYCRAADRLGSLPGLRNHFLGFRPALVPSR